MQHRFQFAAGNRAGAIAATVVVKGGFYDRKAREFVTMDAISEALGIAAPETPPFTAAMEALLNSEDAIRNSDRADATANDVPAQLSDVQR